jgi:peptidoglycan/LPS O-acetylase OafA/YrhL
MPGIVIQARPPDAQDRAQGGNIPALTGLRFFAAASVALAHYSDRILNYDPPDEVTQWLARLGPFGMTLFFVLSGFVIHYNYRYLATAQGWTGIGRFLWARFARLYPLFLLMLGYDLIVGRQLFDFVAGNVAGFTEIIRALPYYLLFVHSWVYAPGAAHSLVNATGGNITLSWSISTEWFFYLVYPALALLILRVRRPLHILGAMLIWTVLWGGLASILAESSPEIDAWAADTFGEIASQAHGDSESFVRWLLYLSPYLRIGEFILGCLTAQLYIRLRDRAVTAREQAIGRLVLAVGAASVPLCVFLCYSTDYPSPLLVSLRDNYALAPSIAIVLFAAARYENTATRLLRNRLLVALGEASYSLYLTHFLILILISGYVAQSQPATFSYITYLILRLVFAVSLICLISLGLHAAVEVPARRWLRGLWQDGGARQPHLAVSIAILPAVAALLFLALRTHHFPDKSEVVAGIRVVSATYGGSCGAPPGNVTRALMAACNSHESCDYVVDVAKLGDPAGGCAKDFVLNYACMPGDQRRDAEIPAEAGLGSHVDLACTPNDPASQIGSAAALAPPPAAGLEILSATYGGNCGAPGGNATVDVRAACSGKARCNYVVDVDNLGDPVGGCGKDFVATYQCPGKSNALTREVPAEAGFRTAIEFSCP